MEFGINHFKWTRKPERYTVSDDRVEIITRPHTDLWQRTYYHFLNDNAPVFQMETNEQFQHLGSVVTNNGYSDWATTAIDASVKSMWYRLSRREDDYCIECSTDGKHFTQIRICHMWHGGGKIRFGIYACSPEDSSFKATFTNMKMTQCQWLAHNGQAPDKEG